VLLSVHRDDDDGTGHAGQAALSGSVGGPVCGTGRSWRPPRWAPDVGARRR